ncbi:uncharacterized protein ATC70_009394 [Mucor velutinosus]|uniref:Late embryogenesis abundant protein n=1 Tax=Mucor velutinosus TaxID=708070 RepID=A0AAN7DLF3_9FUNG|nr:hypothetical protein ATC70_009394 [Mucor velutinosus]
MSRLVSLSLFTRSFTRQHLIFRPSHARYSSTPIVESKVNMEESMNKIEELFSAAKNELEYADESQGTTYYHEDLATAEKAVNEVLTAYNDFLEALPSDDMRNEVKTKVGMKMKELKMTFDALPEEGH